MSDSAALPDDTEPLRVLADPAVSESSVVYTGIRRWLLLAFAAICLALAFVGVWVPGMPTTVFVLMSAWAAMRSSPRLHAWLEAHAVFGPLLRNWREHRAVSWRAKWLASVTMTFCALLCFLTAPAIWMAWLGTGIMVIVAIWLWLRPEPPQAPESR